MTQTDETAKLARREFADPAAVVSKSDLSDEDEPAILGDWRTDLLELQAAADENMPVSTPGSGSAAEALSQVMEALRSLR